MWQTRSCRTTIVSLHKEYLTMFRAPTRQRVMSHLIQPRMIFGTSTALSPPGRKTFSGQTTGLASYLATTRWDFGLARFPHQGTPTTCICEVSETTTYLSGTSHAQSSRCSQLYSSLIMQGHLAFSTQPRKPFRHHREHLPN